MNLSHFEDYYEYWSCDIELDIYDWWYPDFDLDYMDEL